MDGALKPPFAGFDRADFSPNPVSARRRNTGLAWYDELYTISNFRFCAIYLRRSPAKVDTDTVIDREIDSQVRLNWMANINDLEAIGFGQIFTYIGYSFMPERPISSNETQDQRTERRTRKITQFPVGPDALNPIVMGTFHGNHVKKIISKLRQNCDGCVVYIDNEDSTGDNLPDVVLQYYRSLFTEMSTYRQGANLPTIRVGLYAHPTIAFPLLLEFPDIFFWSVLYTNRVPFSENNRGVQFNFTVDHSLSAVPVFPLLRQVYYYKGRPFPKADIGPNLYSVNNWDFNVSMVRDPRYPIANPRLKGLVSVWIEGSFERTKRNNATITHMALQEVLYTQPKTIPTGQTVEPESPMCIIKVENYTELFVFSNDKTVKVFRRSAIGAWTLSESVFVLIPRRHRALSVSARTPDETHLFTVGIDNILYASRRTVKPDKTTSWTDVPQAMAESYNVHPLSNIASVNRGDESVDVFFVDAIGLLRTAWWNKYLQNWPDKQHQALQSSPTLLVGTAIEAVSPNKDSILVFAIDKKLQLNVIVFNKDRWGMMQQLTSSIFAHSRLSSCVHPGYDISVTAISTSGTLCVYTLSSSMLWNASSSAEVVYGNPPSIKPENFVPPPVTSQIEPAFGLTVNPFGDIGISNTNFIVCAGSDFGKSVMMYLNTNTAKWFTVRN